MPIFTRSIQALMADSLEDLSRNTNITKLEPGGKARAILESLNKRLSESYDIFDLQLARSFVSTASGEQLDLIGSLLGATRIPAQAARVDSDLRVIKFYVNTGTFGDINSGSDITVPVGVKIGSATGGRGIVYRTIEEVVLDKNNNAGFISAEAVAVGENSNVGTGSLAYHNFTDYSDYLNETLLVTNIAQIATGSSLESDANFRYRIVNRVLEAEAANEMAIRLAALSAPGVADVLLIPRYRGIGTFAIIVQSVYPTVSDSLIDNVEANIKKVQAYGSIAYVRKPLETGLAFRTSIHYRRRLDPDNYEAIENSIIEAVELRVNNLDIGESLALNPLVNIMFGISDEVVNFGVPGIPLEEVYIYKESRVRDNRIREILTGDYATATDERVIMEPTLNTRITFDRKFVKR